VAPTRVATAAKVPANNGRSPRTSGDAVRRISYTALRTPSVVCCTTVEAGAEGRIGPGEHDGPDVGVVLGGVERLHQTVDEL